jgi:hypothetical protein
MNGPFEGLFERERRAMLRRRYSASCGKADPVFRTNDTLFKSWSIDPKSANPLLGSML